MTHPGAKFFFICEAEKSDKLFALKSQWWDRHRMDILNQGKTGKEKWVMGPKQDVTLAGQISLGFKALD